MKHLIKYKDGSIGIMTTVLDETKPENEFLKLSQEDQDKIHSHRPMDESEMPSDRYFRNAWIHHEDKIHIDIEKCRNIHRDNLRELRRPKLEALDLEFMRASEKNDEPKKNEIISKKQELRDITMHQSILNASTPDELKAFMPEILK